MLEQRRGRHRTSIWNVDSNIEEKQDPGLRIQKCFLCLLNFKLPVNNSSLICCESLDRMISLLLGEKLGVHGVIWEEDECDNGPQHR